MICLKSQGFITSPNCVQTLSKCKNSQCYRLHTVHMKLCKVGLTPDFFPSTSLDLYIVGKILKTSDLVSNQSKIIYTKKSATYVRFLCTPIWRWRGASGSYYFATITFFVRRDSSRRSTLKG